MTRVASRKWRVKHPDKVKARNRAFRKKNPKYTREWYKANIDRERLRARDTMRRSRKAKPELELARKQRYRTANLETVRMRERENTQRRRALQGSCSPELAELMARLVREPCAYCGSTTNVTIDHVIPLSRGGKHEADNLAPACLSCNCSKCALLLDEWQGP
jgi:5-methylcytosine-specific restriction endonuclease McrA